jgi:hypothetical protein
VIDGQQRLTTVTLLLAALANALGETEPVDGFSARKVRNYYLLNPEETGERHYKLLLSQTDKTTLTAIRPANAPEQIGYVDISSVTRGEVEKVDWMKFSDAPGRARRKVRDGSIIWSTVRPNRRSHALIYDPSDDLIVSTGFAVIDANGISVAYLYHFLTTDDFVGYT